MIISSYNDTDYVNTVQMIKLLIQNYSDMICKYCSED